MFATRERSSFQVALAILLVSSLGLNVYLLFFKSDAKPPTITENQPDGVNVADVPAPGAAPAGVADVTPPPASAPGVADSAGKIVDPATGMRYLKLVVEGSFAQTFNNALGAQNGDLVSAVFARIFVWKLDLRSDVYRNDEIQLLYRILPDLNEVEIEAAAYLSRKQKQTFQAYRYQDPTKKFKSYFDENGQEIAQRLENSPLEDYEQITALLRDRSRHNGMDFKTPVGTRVLAPFKGKVTRMNWNAPNGTCLEIEGADRTTAKFLHLSRISGGINPGKTVAAGEVIAESGNTGHSTAPHLHYQLENAAGKVLDPINYHKTYNAKLGQAHLADFEAVRKRLAQHFTL